MTKISRNSNNDLNSFVWQRTRKREGAVLCGGRDAIVSGGRGERWPVERELFETLCRPEPSISIGEDGRYRNIAQEVDATRLTAPFHLELNGQQGTLSGNAGEWIVRKQTGSTGIVAEDIFPATYYIIT